MKSTTYSLYPDTYYHIYNRGNNRENLFKEERNYSYFLSLYDKYVGPVVETYAYCLMINHFHLLVRIKELQPNQDTAVKKSSDPSHAFANLFNAYAKAINKGYGRTGSLFEGRFGRIPVATDAYFQNLIFYIHYNPQKHGLVKDFQRWKWSSFNSIMGHEPTWLQRDAALNVFGGIKGFNEFHQGMVVEKELTRLIDTKFDQET
jgi:putative transposase